MGTTRVILQSAADGPDLHFINGSLYPSGTAVDVDLKALGLKSVDDTFVPPKEAPPAPVELAPNLTKVSGKTGDDLINYEVASISPTGPDPKAPQALPAGAVQIGETFVAPASAEADSAGVAITAESADTSDTTKKGK